MFSQKPIIIEYDFDTSSVWDENMYLNAMYSENGKFNSFRCPNKNWRPLRLDFRNAHFVIHDSNGSIHSKRWNCSLRQIGANRYQYELLNKRNAIRAA